MLAVVLYAAAWFAPLFDGLAPLSIDRTSEGSTPRIQSGRRVVLVSIDGLAARFLDAERTPTLDRLASEGIRAEGVVTVVPSITMTSHASMLSGLVPKEHGVFFNRFEPWRKLRFPTIYSICREAQLGCGLFAGKRKFVHFAEYESGVERYQYAEDSEEVFRRALHYAEQRDPDFLFVHLAEVDRMGHQEGWGSTPQRLAIADIDAQLGEFVDGLIALARPLAILVTADHGGSDTTHHQDTPLNREIPWVLWGDRASITSSQVHSTLDTYEVIRQLLSH
ncbi:MAG: hypothetical protein GY723_06415 [bacterium]|nr:hypothetical protein [bacterium]